MVQAPVGIRCKECGKAVRMPTYDVKPTFYARAVGVAVVVAIVGTVLWVVLSAVVGLFLSSIAAIGVGYGAGELISLSVNRKRSMGLAWLAGGSVVAAFLIHWIVLRSVVGPFGFSVWGLLFVVIGVAMAVKRVRP